MSPMSEISRREYTPPKELAKERAIDRPVDRARATDDADATREPDESDGSGDTDATRSVQDLIAAAMKMFGTAAPKAGPAEPASVPAIEVPAIQFAAAPTIEAAIQQVLDQIAAKPADTDEPTTSTDEPKVDTQAPDGSILVEPELQTAAPLTARGPVATTAVREPAPLPENPNPSHVHLVLDDGPERVVVTVAVRGNEVNATIRGGDEQMAAAIARNAASLDHALRAGGLDLSSFSSERDLDHHAPREHAQREQDPEYADFGEDMT